MARNLNPSFRIGNAARDRRPRIGVQIIFPTSSPTLTSHTGIANVPGTEIQGVIQSVSTASQQVYPEQGRATIGNLTVDLIDAAKAFTIELRDQLNNAAGVRDREVRVFVGFTDDWTDFERVGTLYVDGVSYKNGVYTLTARDISKTLRQDIFTPKKTRVSALVSATATTIPVQDTTGFQMVPHGTSFNDAPGSTVGYLIVKDTGEIIRYTGKTGTTFTGCTRGAFRTKSGPIDFDAADAQADWPEVEEFIYLELPAPAAAIAVMTGILDVNASPRPMLPDHWHLGLDYDTAFDNGSWQAIGADLWDPGDYTKGLPVRFTHLDTTDGKAFVEKEILSLAGLFAPVNVTGQLGLRRVNRIVRATGYEAWLNKDNVVKHGDLQYSHDITNQFRIDYNWDGKDLTREVYFQDSESISLYGTAPLKTFEFKGLHTASHTTRLIQERLGLLRDRYSHPPMKLSVTCTPDMNGVELGDIVVVDLEDLQDHASGSANLLRSFEVQRVGINWTNGNVDLELFATSRSPGALGQNPTNDPPLADAWYTSAGANLTTLGAAGGTWAGGTLAGTTDVNAPASIWYYAGDLTITGGVTISGNVQLRVKGFLQVNGLVDGAGNGIPGTADPDTYGATSTGWVKPAAAGGWMGPTRSGDAGWRYSNSGDLDMLAPLDGQTTLPASKQVSVPKLQLSVNGSGQLSGFPTDLRGCGAAAGAQWVERGMSGALGSGGTVKAKGGTGGDSGAGLAIVCRGLGFGVSGQIDLSGTDGSPGGSSGPPYITGSVYDARDTQGGQLTDFPVTGGSGAGGAPGALYVILDGDGVVFPDLGAGALLANQGATPVLADRHYAVDLETYKTFKYPMLRWSSSLNSGRGIDQSPVPFLMGFNRALLPAQNLWIAASSIQYAPNTGVPAEILRPPLSLSAQTGVGYVNLRWNRPTAAGWDTVEIFASEINDRAFAEEVGQIRGDTFQHWLPSGGTRYYWVRARIGGKVSTFYPTSATGGVIGTAQDAGIDMVISADPTRLWNGDASLTPISWNPTVLFTDMHCQVLQFGQVIAHATARVALNPITGQLTYTINRADPNISVTASATPSNTIRFRFTHTPTGLYADDEVVAVQSGLPGSDGTPGKPGNRIVSIKANYSTFSAATNGWLYVHGFDDLGNPADVDGDLPYNGTIITMTAGSIRTSQAVSEGGWILFDTALAGGFAHGGTLTSMAAARKTRDGWRYDNGAAWSTFTATASMLVVGTYDRDVTQILTAVLFGGGLSLAAVPVEAAVEVRPGDIQPGAIDELAAFASTLRPVPVRGVLPTLPDTNYPDGQLLYLLSDKKVYRADYATGTWIRSTDGADIIAGTISAAALAADIILGTLIRTANTGTRVELSGTSGDPFPFWIGEGEKGTVSGTPGALAALWYDKVAKVLGFRGLIEASEIKADQAGPLTIRTASGYKANMNLFLQKDLIAITTSTSWQDINSAYTLYHPNYSGGGAAQRLQVADQAFRIYAILPVFLPGVSDNVQVRLAYRYDGGSWQYTATLAAVTFDASNSTGIPFPIARLFRPKLYGWTTSLDLILEVKASGVGTIIFGGSWGGTSELTCQNTGPVSGSSYLLS